MIAPWGQVYSRWWAFQWAQGIGPINIGVHLELRARRSNNGTRYGPYLDLHLPWCVLSLGRHPILTGEFDLRQSYSRGGVDADHDQGRF